MLFLVALLLRNLLKWLWSFKLVFPRLLINKIPSGVYKLSREAILAAELPVAFTTRSNWRGSFPREILSTFCRQHRLAEPVFSTQSRSLDTATDLHGTCKKFKVTDSIEEENRRPGLAAVGGELEGPTGAIQCEVKIFSKQQDLILQCLPTKAYKKQTDAIQNAALKVLSWLNVFFGEANMSSENLSSLAKELDVIFYSEYFLKEFFVCPLVHSFWRSIATIDALSDCRHMKPNDYTLENIVPSLCIGGQSSGVHPSSGSLVCISYSACLVTEGGCMKEHLESNEEFEFEIGSRAVIPHIEAIATQISVGQSACFSAELPPEEFILAAADDSVETSSLLSSSELFVTFSFPIRLSVG